MQFPARNGMRHAPRHEAGMHAAFQSRNGKTATYLEAREIDEVDERADFDKMDLSTLGTGFLERAQVPEGLLRGPQRTPPLKHHFLQPRSARRMPQEVVAQQISPVVGLRVEI